MKMGSNYDNYDPHQHYDDLKELARLREDSRRLEARVQELLEANTRLVEEKRSIDRLAMVAQMHRVVANAPVEHTPKVPSDERVRLRLRLIAEEFLETLEAALDGSYSDDSPMVGSFVTDARRSIASAIDGGDIRVDMPAFADGLADLAYVIEGAACEFGIPSHEVFAEVHAANMRKAAGPMRDDSKRLKPEGWVGPDVEGVLRKAGYRP